MTKILLNTEKALQRYFKRGYLPNEIASKLLVHFKGIYHDPYKICCKNTIDKFK